MDLSDNPVRALGNCNSIRNWAKRSLLTDFLKKNSVDMALIQETTLVKEDKLYLNG